ncbi:Mechanosensitive ion channel [Halogranum amylolyticum]|uniref:Mechanosensitive ion channel n=1 Tax=Halogranum amylolyticum TaxID=660520 RepID=A0A1H8T9R4_9EURY|nr:mechanosensitive ion channel domain-containing protein [Halogranum amylolyticum]SEO87314.1 Mechanosensitive ion channel [Halogranum amylolyticum]
MQVEQVLTDIPPRWWLALVVLFIGILLSYVVTVVNRRLLERAGVPRAIEGTAFERMAHELGTSTVSIVAKLSGYFVFLLTLFVALTVAQIEYTTLFWSGVVGFLPGLFLAVLILIVGIVVGDKVELLVQERLRSIKVPEVNFLPRLAKYSVFYVAALIALSQVGVATLALIVLLAVYALAVVLFSLVAFRPMLQSGAAGTYLLLTQTYGIGDEIRIGERNGIVQEVDVFVTRIETDGEEYIIPNQKVFDEGVVRIR